MPSTDSNFHQDPRPDFKQQTWDAAVQDDLRQLVRLGVREELDHGYDWTTVALISESSQGEAAVVAREPGRAAGLAAIPVVLAEMECQLAWNPQHRDGSDVAAGQVLGHLRGSIRDLLTSERLVLNFVGLLSGTATLAAEYVRAVQGTDAEIYDTRKTHPGYRRLQKYAVQCGGARNHRRGLDDAVLIKDNHLAFAQEQQGLTIADAVTQAREFLKQTLPGKATTMVVEVEVDTLAQFDAVLPAEPDVILLDNMSLEELRTAVQRRHQAASPTRLEASGGVNLATVAEIAGTGVDRISVGALTHSARCLDIGLDWQA